jgi:hypothetical protein
MLRGSLCKRTGDGMWDSGLKGFCERGVDRRCGGIPGSMAELWWSLAHVIWDEGEQGEQTV